ncbi:Coenzyme F420 hydrogenase/dehydrogenase, beta subunit C-terminal domain [[Clostridium] spiroforme]|nr:Coenzyme F420 hydrogenase/dehydrogenase, beta subunit C-terminal domain [Thomasclavelia spiroformis]
MLICKHDECCGCSNCETICNQNAILMQLDDEGFIYPQIDDKKCIKCNACKYVCPVMNDLTKLKSNFAMNTYYAYLNNENELACSSSGGVASALSEVVIHNGGVVYGVAYDDGFNEVSVKRATKLSELNKFKGSKYIQSYKKGIFKSVKNDLEKHREVLYIGLPCEIAALKLYLKKDYDCLYLIDLVCHGPTSHYALNDYINKFKRFNTKIISFSMRYKKNNKWIPYYMHILFDNEKEFMEPFWGSDFGFIFGRFGRPSCYNCKFKESYHFSDLTIGDAWGTSLTELIGKNTGLSAVVVNSLKGERLLKTTKKLCLLNAKKSEILKGNPNLVQQREYSYEREYISYHLKRDGLKNTVKKLKPFKRRLMEKLSKLKQFFR